MVLKLLLLFLLINLISGSQVEEIRRKLEKCKGQSEEFELKSALEALEEVLDYAPFYKNNHKKCKGLEDYEESKEMPEQYDFVVVGGGTSGSILARRLSEEPKFKVLLLAKGGVVTPLSKVPVLTPYIFFTKTATNRFLEPEDDVGYGMEDHKIVVTGGSPLGGSSIIGNGVVTKPPKAYFDSWGKDWCGSVSKYFLKYEKANLTGKIDIGSHNFDGPLAHSDGFLSPLGETFLKCGAENGLPEIDDTGDLIPGVCRVKTLTENGRKQNHADAFLHSVKERPNLIVKEDCTAYKVLINENKRAYGVQYLQGDKKYTVLAKKEIILGLGTFKTPQLLMLSGVGPKKHLEEHGIKCIHDLPVGENMHDIISYIGLMYEVNSTAPSCLQDLINKENSDLFLKTGGGPLASANSIESSATVKINSDVPNVKIQLVSRSWALDKGEAIRKTVGISKCFYENYFKNLEGKRVVMAVPIVPAKSSGRIKLKSSNPLEDPLLFGCYYSNPADRATMIQAIEYTLNFMKCSSFKKFSLTFYDKPVPGCAHKKGKAYLECITKYLTVSYQDQTGTCKMGPRSDPKAVVDFNLKVHGIDSLRVIGAPVIPESVPGGSISVTTMMTEKVADDIKNTYGVSLAQFCPPK